MTTFTRAILTFAITTAVAMPVAAGQSANRTGNGPANPPKAAGKTIKPEAKTVGTCPHCVNAASHQAHQVNAENQTRDTSCCGGMTK